MLSRPLHGGWPTPQAAARESTNLPNGLKELPQKSSGMALTCVCGAEIRPGFSQSGPVSFGVCSACGRNCRMENVTWTAPTSATANVVPQVTADPQQDESSSQIRLSVSISGERLTPEECVRLISLITDVATLHAALTAAPKQPDVTISYSA